MDRVEEEREIRVQAGATPAEHLFVHRADECDPVVGDIAHPEHLADVLGDLTESRFALPQLVALLPEGVLDLPRVRGCS